MSTRTRGCRYGWANLWRRPRAAEVLLALLGAAVGACSSVGPSFEPPVTSAPPDWTSWHGGSASLAQPELRSLSPQPQPDWWQGFADPILNELQQRAQRANSELQTAALRLAQSRIERQSIAGQLDPRVDAKAGVFRQRQSETGASTRLLDAIATPANKSALIEVLSAPFGLYQAGFDASWELDLWGRVRRSVEAADASVLAAAAVLRDVQASVLAEVARNYFELRGTQRQLRIAREDIGATGEALELVQALADGGRTTDLDVTRQRSQLEDLRARVPVLLEQEAQAINRITLLLGEHPGALQTELAADTAVDDAIRMPDLALGVPSDLARRRPDIAAAQARLHAATARIGVAVAELYPRITLGASAGLESVSAGRFGEWGSRLWSIGPSLTLPIFDQGRRRASITLRELDQQEAAVRYQHTVLNAWHEIDSALSAYTAERQRHARLADKERSSRDALVLAQVRYRNGLTDFLSELDAQRTLLAARRELAESSSRMALRLVAVYKALGGSPTE